MELNQSIKHNLSIYRDTIKVQGERAPINPQIFTIQTLFLVFLSIFERRTHIAWFKYLRRRRGQDQSARPKPQNYQ